MNALLALGLLLQIQLPQPVGFVNDFANVIPAASKSRIERVVQDVRAKSGGEIVVVTLQDLSGRDPSDVARQIGRQWRVGASGGPGDRARNTGVIILVVPKETSRDGRGHVRIETGYGAEGFITDATAGAIQDEAIPALRERDYGGAIELMALRVAQRFAREFQFTLDSRLRPVREPVGRVTNGGGGVPPFVWLLLFFIIISLLRGGGRRRRRGCVPIILPFPGGGWGGRGGRGGWHGGGFGGGGFGGGGFGGFGGFGGSGGFGGGGAGRSW